MEAKDRSRLKARAHHLKPVVSVGAAGLSEAVLTEVGLALDHHELIKVKIGAADRDERRLLMQVLCEKTGAELVQHIGHTAVLYRPRPENGT